MGSRSGAPDERGRLRTHLLLANVVAVAVSALVYELLAGTVASYLLGDAVAQFSVVIGLSLSAMGLGALLSRRLEPAAPRRFLQVELALALIGGLSAPVLLLGFGRVGLFRPLLYADVAVVGVLVGLELPLLMHLLRAQLSTRDLVARALAFDYLGSLAASLLFPLLLMPRLGIVRTSIVAGLLNGGVALAGTWVLRPRLGGGVRGLRAAGIVVIAALTFALLRADAIAALGAD